MGSSGLPPTSARDLIVAPPVVAPLHLTPLLVPKPWGGRRLERFGRALPEGATIGESWEVADLDAAATSVSDPVTRVATGPHAGRRLSELIAADGGALLGDAPDLEGRFPLLVKLLDAREPLSVQVHPPQAYVAEEPGVALKTETWVVLDAQPGSQLMIGVADGVTPDRLAATLGTPAMVSLLRHVPAVIGEVHHLPAGTIHALGAGVMVAEVQTPSDTTFRLYDWAETGGRPARKLHLAAGWRAIELGWEHNLAPVVVPASRTNLVDTSHYRLDRHHLGAAAERPVDAGVLRVVQVLEGHLEGDGFSVRLRPGGTVVLPAAWSGTLRASDHPATWLETTIPGGRSR